MATEIKETEHKEIARTTSEALAMITEQEDGDVVFGRMPVGGSGDESEFDALPPREVDLTEEDSDDISGQTVSQEIEDAPPAVFESPREEQFPMLKSAIQQFQDGEKKPRVVRIDTEKTYGDFSCERAVKEITRRLTELRAALEDHLAEHGEEMHPGYHQPAKKLRQWDEIVGAAEAVQKIRSAKTPDDALDAMPQVPVDVPAFAQGKVKCWKDGKNVVCSLRFQAADGTGRVATMAATPKANAEGVLGWALKSGVNPITILGVLPDLADAACAKRLVRDVAGAALAARRRLDVVGQSEGFLSEAGSPPNAEEPIMLVGDGDEAANAPLAAIMHVEMHANAGNPQAQKEMNKLRLAASTPSGQKIAAPLLAESTARLAAARQKQEAAVQQTTFMGRYTQLGMCL